MMELSVLKIIFDLCYTEGIKLHSDIFYTNSYENLQNFYYNVSAWNKVEQSTFMIKVPFTC